ncbi:hypothetical protein [Nitrolancea hollandica]|uniref:UBC core domain-containing protein n=1 Tax=Nitrolancea hollandica Lb TaxID=1129897 RepID=I4ELS1_9BACT|nr:hypothetical protein [Nitrolancea hollandica]CCF85633.1 hypothetical protein NITHO_5270002 [Nitrolancea hollandica Lb]
MCELRWFDVDRARLVLEYHRVQEAFPGFVLHQRDGDLAWEGSLVVRLPGIGTPPLQVRLLYPAAYPVRPPRIMPVNSDIPDERWGHKWHRWQGGAICIVEPAQWEIGYTAADALTKASDWYFNYLAVNHGLLITMPDVGRADIDPERVLDR